MTVSEYEKSIIALAAWHPFREEGTRGMVCAAMALRNRANKGWFDGSLYWNAVAELKSNPATEYADGREPEFMMLLQAIDGVVSGRTDDRTGGALYWAPLSQSETIIGERTAQVGRFVFFK